MRKVCKNVSSWPTDLFRRFCWNDSAGSRFPATTTQLFSQSLSSHTICRCLENLSTTKYLCNLCKLAPRRDAAGTIYLLKKEMQFSQYFVQVHRNTVHVVDQYFYRRQSLLVLKQPSCNVFPVRNEFWRFFWKSEQDEWYRQEKIVFIERLCLSCQCEYYEGIFEQRSGLQFAKCLRVHVLSSNCNVSRLELRNKTEATESSCRQQYCTESDPCMSWESVCGQCRKQNLVCEVLFLSNLPQLHYQHYFRKCVPAPY